MKTCKQIRKHDEKTAVKVENNQLCALILPNNETLYMTYEDGTMHVNVVGKEIDDCNCADSTTKLLVYA